MCLDTFLTSSLIDDIRRVFAELTITRPEPLKGAEDLILDDVAALTSEGLGKKVAAGSLREQMMRSFQPI